LDDGIVMAFTQYGSALAVGGSFTSIGNTPVNRIALWNGANWSPVGLGFNGTVNTLTAAGSLLYAAGDFTSAGGNQSVKTAYWNGNNWSPLGSGITSGSSTVYASSQYNSDIIFGGHFTSAGGNPANNIADWNTTLGINHNGSEIPAQYVLSQNYPNPFNPSTQIEFGIPKQGFVKLAVYNSEGQEVAVLVNESLSAGNYNIPFDASALSSGVYFYKLAAGNNTLTKKMILVK